MARCEICSVKVSLFLKLLKRFLGKCKRRHLGAMCVTHFAVVSRIAGALGQWWYVGLSQPGQGEAQCRMHSSPVVVCSNREEDVTELAVCKTSRQHQ